MLLPDGTYVHQSCSRTLHSCKNCLTCWLQKVGSLLANISSGAPHSKKIDDSWRIMLCNKPLNRKTCRPTVDKGEEVVSAIVGDIYSYPLPHITCSQLTFFPFYRCWVDWHASHLFTTILTSALSTAGLTTLAK